MTSNLVLDPYKIGEKTILNFSGGRTSGFLLRKVLDANVGGSEDLVVCFQNTGREFPETLDFIHEIETRWEVPVVWLEFKRPTGKNATGRWQWDDGECFTVVDYETASRKGEPFENVIWMYNGLPNVKQRWCTTMMKVRPARDYLRKRMGWDSWTSFLGIRHDEPNRWRTRGIDPTYKREDRELPLVRGGVTERDVARFWELSDFDVSLALGRSNCDLCFLKGKGKRLDIMRDRPEAAQWWIDKEKETGRQWDKRSSYEKLAKIATSSPRLPLFDEPDISTCYCTD
jgi:3'-phosphoadenosine 5'-phosphosulfate sulfotransferase (PAPS reductase)/FAD synthetase